MAAYMIVKSAVTDEDRYSEYRDAVMPLIERFGGLHIRGGQVELLEGDEDDRRLAIFFFPSMEAIHAFWDSPEYVPVKAIRDGAADLTVWAVPILEVSARQKP